jgi:hypothetical protein
MIVASGHSSFIKSLIHSLGIILGPCGSPVCNLIAILPSILSFTFSYIFLSPSGLKSRVKYTIDSSLVLSLNGIYLSPPLFAILLFIFVPPNCIIT